MEENKLYLCSDENDFGVGNSPMAAFTHYVENYGICTPDEVKFYECKEIKVELTIKED